MLGVGPPIPGFGFQGGESVTALILYGEIGKRLHLSAWKACLPSALAQEPSQVSKSGRSSSFYTSQKPEIDSCSSLRDFRSQTAKSGLHAAKLKLRSFTLNGSCMKP